MPPRLRKSPSTTLRSASPGPSRYQCLRQPPSQPFSSNPRISSRQRRIMFSWLNGPGANFRHPLPGSTNYLNAYDPSGQLIRVTNHERQQDSDAISEEDDSGASTERNLKGDKPIPKETLDDLIPFPMNRQFRSQPVLSEDFKDEIHQRWQSGDSVRRISADLRVEMRRVGAVVRLKTVEKQWKSQGKPLAVPYARAMQSMLPLTHFTPNVQPVQHESINDLPVHAATLRQAFHPVSESRHFTRTDAGRVFDPDLLPADARVPHPELVESARDRLSGMVNEERINKQKDRDEEEKLLEESKEKQRKTYEAKNVKKIQPEGGRWEFRFRDMRVDEVAGEKDWRGVGSRYGVPPQDRKRGQVKIPKRVDCV